MDLLNTIVAEAVDPDYATVAARGRPPRRRAALAASALVIGLLFAIGATLTTRAAPAESTERGQLIDRIRAAEGNLGAQRERVGVLRSERADLEARAAGLDAATRDRLEALAVADGTVAVRGPGVVLTLDDGPDVGRTGSQVVDADLLAAVNGLWQAGAEAIAVNGHRLTSRTAIRGAGQAITVDYRSLTRPYVIEAIGDGRRLADGFAASSGGGWWRSLREQYGMRLDVARSADLRLPADEGLGVRVATRER